MPTYPEFLKKWSSVNNITSFFGSDKPDFLRDWKLAKAGTKFEISRGKFIPTSKEALKTFNEVNALKNKINKPVPREVKNLIRK
jgi:hypothetical protein